jgi:DNA-binding NtrC family response regulator
MKGNDGGERILIVDDSLDMIELLQRQLEKAGFQVVTATAVPQAIDIVGSRKIDIVVTDLKMPGISGLELVRHVRDNLKDTEILLITGYPSVDGAVEAMKTGAADYLPKPFTSAEFLAAIGRLLDKLRARRSLQVARAATESVPGMIGESKGMQIAFDAVRTHAADSFPVLITGEHGTGRRSIARAIHLSGPRASNLFAAVDPYTPTGSWFADSIATIYLAEPGTLPRKEQEELLRRLDAGTGPRVITSTSIDLAGLATRGTLDEKLYSRLSSVRINLPPLVERGNDLLYLIRHFAERGAREVDRSAPSFSDRALDALRGYPWPGNVKELWWTIRRLVANSEGTAIDVPDLPSHMRFSIHGSGAPNRPLAAIETAYIQDVLASVGGNRTRAAEILGIDRKTLRQKVRRASEG